jgi:hypothetical protein
VELPNKPSLIVEPPEAYHARTEISKTMLADFLDRKRLFEGRYISKTIPAKRATKSMEIGTLVHAAILEPERIDEMYVIIPESLLSGANRAIQSKEAKAFVAAGQAEGKHVVKEDEIEMIRAMAESVRATVGPWLGTGALTERTIIWQHPATGLMCRCKPDWIRPTKNGTAIAFDVKTTGDISEHGFRGTMESFAYWLQDAHYSEGIAAVTGKPVEQFIFVTVEGEPPYQCRPFQLDDESREASVVARERLIVDLAECMTTGNFAEAWEGTVTKIPIRGFAFKQGDAA